MQAPAHEPGVAFDAGVTQKDDESCATIVERVLNVCCIGPYTALVYKSHAHTAGAEASAALIYIAQRN